MHQHPGFVCSSVQERIVQLYLCLIKHHIIKAYEQMEVQIHALLISAQDEGERSASCCDHIAPTGKQLLVP
jgi:hypothetical protein